MPLSNDSRFTASTIWQETDTNGGGDNCEIFALDANTYFVTFTRRSGANHLLSLAYTTDGGTTWRGSGGTALPASGGAGVPITVDTINTSGGNIFFGNTKPWARDANNILIAYQVVNFNTSVGAAKVAVSSTGALGAFALTTLQTGQITDVGFFDNGTEGFYVSSNYDDGNNYLYKSADWATWDAAINIDTLTSALGGVYSTAIDVWGAGSSLFVAFEWFRGFGTMVSQDCGATWTDDYLNGFNPGPGDCVTLRIRSLDETNVYCFYVSNNNTGPSFSENGYVKSTDAGFSFGAAHKLDNGNAPESTKIGLFLANANEWLAVAGADRTSPKKAALYQFSAGDTLASETSIDEGDAFGNHVYDFIALTAVNPSCVLVVNFHNATNGPGTKTVMLHKSNTAITGAFGTQLPHSCAPPTTPEVHGETATGSFVAGETSTGSFVAGETFV